jgi:pimeloyl-ACP methyl ester carboxylesterase
MLWISNYFLLPIAALSASNRNEMEIGLSTLDWLPCGQLQCANLFVPLNHRDPNSRKIKISLSRCLAKNQPALRTVVLGPNRPGSSCKKLLASSCSYLAELFDNVIDFVSFDPRGSGDSEQLECTKFTFNAFKEADVYFGANILPRYANRKHFIKYDMLMDKNGKYCRAFSDELVDFISTSDAAHDLDLVREALGMNKLHYL